MLTTEVNLVVKAGNGGNGKVSFFKTRKGPDGGNGGKGGDIYLAATTNIYQLNQLAKVKKIEAENGQDGMANKKTGRNGQDQEIRIPIGSVITDQDSQETFTINQINQRFLICRGGAGGLGNWEFRSSTNTTPKYAQKGEKGEIRRLHINLKLIADYGLIGFPNAGKSSLLKELTKAKPKIGSYPFTTLEPNLGELNNKIIADIPGLIKGASQGKGLGAKFLKHIEKVKLLFHCLSCESNNLLKDYQTIRNELKAYNPKLLQKPEIILLTKTDLKTKKQVKQKSQALKLKTKKLVLPVSIHDWDSLEKLKDLIK